MADIRRYPMASVPSLTRLFELREALQRRTPQRVNFTCVIGGKRAGFPLDAFAIMEFSDNTWVIVGSLHGMNGVGLRLKPDEPDPAASEAVFSYSPAPWAKDR